MESICEKCGLPKDLCVCQEISKEARKVRILVLSRRFRKLVTLVTGLDEEQAKELGKLLKRKLACGGTVKKSEIELQGDHKRRVKEILMKEGYKEDMIDA